MMEETIRVLLVDDHAIVRHGIRALLTEVAGIEVVGEAGNGREAVAQAAMLQPDVVLMDLVMPGPEEVPDGIEATRRITAAQPEVRVLALTSFAGDDKVFPAIKAGALGYLLKDTEPDALVEAIRQVHRGESSLHPTIARKLLRELHGATPSPAEPEVDPLTEREEEVLRLVATGMTNRQIAEELVISEGTVRSHVSRLLGKLHVANRVQATLYALREGLASLNEEKST